MREFYIVMGMWSLVFCGFLISIVYLAGKHPKIEVIHCCCQSANRDEVSRVEIDETNWKEIEFLDI